MRRDLKLNMRIPTLLATAGLAVTLVLAMSAASQPAYAAPAWTLLLNQSYPGYAPDEFYSLRGVALSPDGSYVYGTWLHTGAGKKIVEYSATTGATLNSSYIADQAKSLAVDSRGYVFAGSGDDNDDRPYIEALSADLQTTYGSTTTPGDPNVQDKRFGGLATLDSGSNHYLYATRESGRDGFYIQRFITNDVSDLTLDTSFGAAGTLNLQDVLGNNIGYPHGIAVASDGTMYVAAYDEHGIDALDPNDSVGMVYKIAPDGSSATSTSVPGAFGLALQGNALYVSEYGEGAYPAVDVLNPSTLAGEGSLDTGYTNTNTSRDSGYSGIAVSPQGYVYLADEFYSSTAYSDRLLVSPQQPPTSKDQCKNGGWQQFDNPHFKNQGDCIQFVNTGK